MTRVESSNHKSALISPASVAHDDPKATTRPMDMSVIIPGWRSLSSSTAPRRKTGPPQRNTRVPKRGATAV